MTFSAALAAPPDHFLAPSSDGRSLAPCRRFPIVVRLGSLRCSRRRPLLRLSASLAERSSLGLSWADDDCASSDSDFNGWAVVESQPPRKRKGVFLRGFLVRRSFFFLWFELAWWLFFFRCAGLPKYVIGAAGTSLAVLVAVVAHYSLSGNGNFGVLFFERPSFVLHLRLSLLAENWLMRVIWVL